MKVKSLGKSFAFCRETKGILLKKDYGCMMCIYVPLPRRTLHARVKNGST
jgi:hypothetical protein